MFLLSLILFAAFNVCLLISFVANRSFPQPLSKIEENKLLKEMKNGSKEAKDKLIECNLRLVAHIVKKCSKFRFEQEDLISIGTIGLIKGINSFKEEKGTKLATYLSKCIENEILMFIRSSKKLRNEVSIEDVISNDGDGHRLTLENVLTNQDEEIINSINDKFLWKNLEKNIHKVLDDREIEILKLRYGLKEKGDREKTQREVAKELGISRSYVSRIEKKILQKLKRSMNF